MGTAKYLDKKIRILIAVVGAFYMVLYGRLGELKAALVSVRFYTAVLVSFFVSLLIINMVQFIWIRLDHFFQGTTHKFVRPIIQVTVSIALSLVADFLCFALYFGIYGENIFTIGFLSDDFLYVFYLLAGLNLLYLWLSFARGPEENKLAAINPNTSDITDQFVLPENVQQLFVLDHKGQHVYLDYSEILYCYRRARKCEVVTKGLGNYSSDATLSNIAGQLQAFGFRQINRSVIINLIALKGYIRGSKRDTLYPVIKTEFKPYFEVLSTGQLSITNEYKEGFKKAFDTIQEEN